MRLLPERGALAPQLASLDSFPVRIVELTDAQAVEASIVENLERRDLHPLEWASGLLHFRHWRSPSIPSSKWPRIAPKAGITIR
jgi:ParB family chromosome partitioning protein